MTNSAITDPPGQVMQPDWKALVGQKFSVFPVATRSKTPAIRSWAEYQSRHPVAEELSEWSKKKQSNVGIVTGKVSNIFVVDCDSAEGFEEVCRRGVPETPRVRTGRGWHLYFAWPGHNVPNKSGLLLGVDIRGDGGYVVGPGSIHPSGAPYRWEPSPREVPIAPAPDWLLDLLEANNGRLRSRPPLLIGDPLKAINSVYADAAHDAEVAAVALAPEGQRNAQLNKSAFKLGSLVKAGALDPEAVAGALLNAAVVNGSILDDGAMAVAKTIASGLRAAQPRVHFRDAATPPDRIATPSPMFFDDEPPRPLTRSVSEPQPFPVDALGPALSAAAKAIEAKVRAHSAICAVSVLAAANLAVQGHADVMLPSGHCRPISLYFVSIAESGDRKSSVDHEALRPVYARESFLREQYAANLQAYRNQESAFERAKETVLKTHAKNERADISLALDRLGPPPEPPLKPALLCSEPTFEGLYKLYIHGQPSIGLFSTEGGSFIGGHGMRDDARLHTATGLSRLWDGVSIDRVRAGDGNLILVGRRLSCHLMLQPDVANLLLADEAMADQGLLSRILAVAPPTLAGTRFWTEVPLSAGVALNTYHKRLEAILQLPLPLAPGRRNEIEPRPLAMSDAARASWIRFADEIEFHLGSGGHYSGIRSRANKGAEMAARVAATLALFDDFEAQFIDDSCMERGVILVKYFLSEARRMAEQAITDRPLSMAVLVLEWLRSEWKNDFVSLPDIYQRGPTAIRDQARAKAVVATLEAHGWLRPIANGATIDGTRRRQAWEVRRKGS